jgi:hypothetical protein
MRKTGSQRRVRTGFSPVSLFTQSGTNERLSQLVPIHKRHLSPDFGVGRQIQILKISPIFLRFESAARLELGRNLPFLDGHQLVLTSNMKKADRCQAGTVNHSNPIGWIAFFH